MSFTRRFHRSNGHAVSQDVTRDRIMRTLASYRMNRTRARRARLVRWYLVSVRSYDVDGSADLIWSIDLAVLRCLLWCERVIYAR